MNRIVFSGENHDDALNQYNIWFQNNPDIQITLLERTMLEKGRYDFVIYYSINKLNFFQKFVTLLKFLFKK
jgi:hypothetical protein